MEIVNTGWYVRKYSPPSGSTITQSISCSCGHEAASAYCMDGITMTGSHKFEVRSERNQAHGINIYEGFYNFSMRTQYTERPLGAHTKTTSGRQAAERPLGAHTMITYGRQAAE